MRYSVRERQALIDALAAVFPESSRTTLRQMLQTGRVRVNGEVEKNAKCELDPDDVIDVSEKAVHRNLPEGLTILHEDGDVIVVLKAHGILTVPTERERDTTVQAYLNAYLGQNKGRERIQVVHRLDRETSGVLVFAKNAYAREQLKEQFAAHTTHRLYVAVVEGEMDPASGTFRSYLREMRDLKMVSVEAHPYAKFAVTHYRTVETNGRFSVLEVKLETGRKNQIRAHLSEARHPIVGDRMYGSEVNPLGRLGLHAKLLGFVHPVTRKQMEFTAPVPKVFRDVLRK
ncbi:MAG TPA: RluA family pseudouridine synthase [Thermoanaerobaculia bacterium]|nr:RluA family pseudouridine synthase [Thermoanaerobaculia bacterium]